MPESGGGYTKRHSNREETPVSSINDAFDKAGDKAQEVAGKTKQVAGDATGDDSMKAEGRKDEAAGNLKQAAKNVKDAVD
jgi:uncharacterized protein YjbJ (UPF0337 family)